jgi:hypothetical protein
VNKQWGRTNKQWGHSKQTMNNEQWGQILFWLKNISVPFSFFCLQTNIFVCKQTTNNEQTMGTDLFVLVEEYIRPLSLLVEKYIRPLSLLLSADIQVGRTLGWGGHVVSKMMRGACLYNSRCTLLKRIIDHVLHASHSFPA